MLGCPMCSASAEYSERAEFEWGNQIRGDEPISPNLIDHLEEMVGLDEPEFLLELIDTYLEDSERTIKLLPHAWQEQDLFGVMRAAHSLKSASATLLAGRLEVLTAQLENQMRGFTGSLDVAEHIAKIVAEYERVHSALLVERAKLVKQLTE